MCALKALSVMGTGIINSDKTAVTDKSFHISFIISGRYFADVYVYICPLFIVYGILVNDSW